MCKNCGVNSCSSCNQPKFITTYSSQLTYDGPKFDCPSNFTVQPGTALNSMLDTLMTQICSKVQSVNGLNTDNTDPQNPIVQLSVDGVTITGSGTPLDPLVSSGGAPFVPIIDYSVVNPRTSSGQNDLSGISVIAPALVGSLKGATDEFTVEVDKIGFLEGIEVSIDTVPVGSTGFVFGIFPNGITYPTAQDYAGSVTGSTINILAGNSSSFLFKYNFAWEVLAAGSHNVVLRFIADPVTGIADKLITVNLLVV